MRLFRAFLLLSCGVVFEIQISVSGVLCSCVIEMVSTIRTFEPAYGLDSFLRKLYLYLPVDARDFTPLFFLFGAPAFPTPLPKSLIQSFAEVVPLRLFCFLI